MGKTVVGVGAGPVGLWLANQIKKRAPDTEVILYEQRPEYIRDNQLSVHHRSLTEHAMHNGDALEAATIAKLNAAHETPGASKPFWRKLHRVIRAPAKVFEGIFREEALARGVKVINQQVESLQQLTRTHPQCSYFLATDGTHSLMRKDVLGPDEVALERKPIQASIDVQYLVHGQAQPLRVATYNECEYMVAETIGKEENGVSRVGLRFLVDQKTFDGFPEANASKPLGWSDLPHSFKHHVMQFQHIRKRHTGEDAIRGIDNVKVTKVQLSCYAATNFAVMRQTEHDKSVGVFFAGNAAIGVPWYKSFNVGVKAASQLAEVVTRPNASLQQRVEAYEGLRQPIVTRSFNNAAKKLKYVQLYRSKIRPKLQLAKTAPIAIPLAVAFAAVAVVAYIPWKIYSRLNPNARLM